MGANFGVSKEHYLASGERRMDFTYYGDLLGISGYYRLNPSVAKEKLNQFYDITFESLSEYCRLNSMATVEMFSDSLLFYGDDVSTALEQLHSVYARLLYKGMLLRGAIVRGRLQFEPRLTYDNYDKKLPQDDTLARAMGLESTKKGARLLIENQLAAELLDECPEWLTQEGYVMSFNNPHYARIPESSSLRRISPTPEQDAYEYLYFWLSPDHKAYLSLDREFRARDLEVLRSMTSESISIHYRETMELLKRSKIRQKVTNERLGIA
jgi:hypothetical protein